VLSVVSVEQQPLTWSTDMTASEVLVNIDLAAGISALVAITMIAVPNLDRIRAARRVFPRERRELTL
jgi:hypothetical protein